MTGAEAKERRADERRFYARRGEHLESDVEKLFPDDGSGEAEAAAGDESPERRAGGRRRAIRRQVDRELHDLITG
ncbi:MAG: hypothetical protein V3S29_01875 [bacterium]